jgi:hypothetical protein
MSTAKTITGEWFKVDRMGLAALLERRGRAHTVIELLSNAWDEQVTRVDVTLVPAGRGLATLIVEDDDPDGFVDLAHAYTLFAETAKRHDATVRGRFNLGEKLVLSICKSAIIASTTGSVAFDESGRRTSPLKRAAGSRFEAEIHLTKSEIAEAEALIHSLIPPPGVVTTFNGSPLIPRHPIHEFEATLDTELADDEGRIRRTARKCLVSLYDPLPGEEASIYEIGIPVVATSDRWHVDINQKVPLNAERDNVTPAFLRKVRTLVVNELPDQLTKEDATSQWTKAALSDPDITGEAARAIAKLRFGEKAVRFDMSDREANDIATSRGYTVVPGGAMSRSEWENMTRAEALPPAGRVTPSPKVELRADGKPPVPLDKWTPGMHNVAAYAKTLGQILLGQSINVVFHVLPAGWAAAFSDGELVFNLQRLGHQWFSNPVQEQVDHLLIHEFGHTKGAGHLDSQYHDNLCQFGARMIELARHGRLPAITEVGA